MSLDEAESVLSSIEDSLDDGTRSPSPSPVPELETGIEGTLFAKRSRALMKLIVDIRALGGQAQFDLPQIAVIGNQSAGKSSLVEAISGIKVPRAAGTCTRCPMECRLQNSDQSSNWKCRVSLRYEVSDSGQPLPGHSIKETPFGPTIHSKDELEQMLRRAQLAILNPSVPANAFVNYDLEQTVDGPPLGSRVQLAFSANVVCVDVSGPNVPNLSFIDLPGIISNVADERDAKNIDDVQNLVRKHIKGNSLILLTTTMRDDIDNQSAARLAREADPQGKRTIGVLTKPDTLQRGEEKPWIDVLKGKRYPLKLGYYITKQPSPTELEMDLDPANARIREREFFDNQAPWNTLPSALHNRIGTEKLAETLSTLLSDLIDKSLPAIRQSVSDLYTKTLEGIARLPVKLTQEPSVELIKMIGAFSAELVLFVRGSPGYEALIRECNPTYDAFARRIKATAPVFVPQNNRPPPTPAPRSPGTVASQEYEYAVPEPVSPKVEASYLYPVPTRTATPRPFIPEVMHNIDEDESGDEWDTQSESMYLSEIKSHVDRFITRELPFNPPYAAKVALITHCFDTWKSLASECFDGIVAIVERHLERLIGKFFDRYAHPALHSVVSEMAHKVVKDHETVVMKQIEWLIKLEDPPFTRNDHYFKDYRRKFLAKYHSQRPRIQSQHYSSDIQRHIEALADLGITVNGLSISSGPSQDPYEREIVVAAEVRAYFQVAYKRIIDNVPRAIDLDLVTALGSSFRDALIDQLQVGLPGGSRMAAELLAESPTVHEERTRLDGQRERLELIREKLVTGVL